MAIDLNKKSKEYTYYYSENGKTLGPYSLSQLIEKIDLETLVYREGIDWTNAKDVEELKFYFKSQPHENFNSNDEKLQTLPIDSSQVKNMFSSPFSFEGRIRRLEYGISLIIYYLFYLLIIGLSHETPIISLAMIPLIWLSLAQGAKRCHDRGNSGWYQIIPFYVFWMLFGEGDKKTNEYGTPPKN